MTNKTDSMHTAGAEKLAAMLREAWRYGFASASGKELNLAMTRLRERDLAAIAKKHLGLALNGEKVSA